MNYHPSSQLVTPLVDRNVDSVLFLSIGLNFIVTLLILFSFRMGEFILQYTNIHPITKATAVRAATVLNGHDNLARMNNLVVQSREFRLR